MGALVGDTVGDVVGGRVVVGAVVGITVGDNVAPACGMPTPTATAIAAAAASVRRLTARGRPKGTAIATAILAAIGRGALASQRLPTRSRTARACTRVQWWSGGGVASSGALPHTHTCSPAPNESTHWGTQSSIWEIAIFSRQKIVAKLSVAEIDCVTVTCADSEVKKQRTRRRPSHMQGPAAGRPLLACLPTRPWPPASPRRSGPRATRRPWPWSWASWPRHGRWRLRCFKKWRRLAGGGQVQRIAAAPRSVGERTEHSLCRDPGRAGSRTRERARATTGVPKKLRVMWRRCGILWNPEGTGPHAGGSARVTRCAGPTHPPHPTLPARPTSAAPALVARARFGDAGHHEQRRVRHGRQGVALQVGRGERQGVPLGRPGGARRGPRRRQGDRRRQGRPARGVRRVPRLQGRPSRGRGSRRGRACARLRARERGRVRWPLSRRDRRLTLRRPRR